MKNLWHRQAARRRRVPTVGGAEYIGIHEGAEFFLLFYLVRAVFRKKILAWVGIFSRHFGKIYKEVE